MLWPYARFAAARSTPALLDGWLPPGAFRLEHHGIDVPGDPETALAAALGVRFRDVGVVRALFTVRGLPHDAAADGTVGRFFATPPFVVLAEEPGREFVFGVVGPFWQWRRGRRPRRIPGTPEEFRAALAAGCMAAVGNFRVEPGVGSVHLWTETWVHAPGARQALPFGAYWLAVGPFSAWIRRLLLRAARRRAVQALADAPTRAG